MLIACGVFAYSVSEIGVIVDSFNSEKKTNKKKLQIINRYME